MTVFVLSVLLFFLSPDSPDTSASYVARFERSYHTPKTLQATFLETYSDGGRKIRSEAGIAYFRKPGKMRWEYEAPEKNVFVVDGKTAWFYVPADHSVTRVPAKDSGDWRTPLALLAGKVKVSQICASITLDSARQPADPSLVELLCKVRRQKGEEAVPDEDRIVFELERESGLLRRLLVRDAGGIDIEFRFAKWQFDPPLPEDLFTFHPPVGTAVVNGDLGPQNSGGPQNR